MMVADEIPPPSSGASVMRELAGRWDRQIGAYKRARRLEDTESRTARGLCEQLISQAFGSAGSQRAAEYLAWMRDQPPAEFGLVAANVSGLVALAHRDWATARALAAENNARDHRDVLAQRIYDAAGEFAPGLDGPVDAWLADRFCSAPFEEMETRENGDVHFCCSAWQPSPIGRLDENAHASWNSPRAQEIRRSVLDGDFSHCSRWHCPRIAGRTLPRRSPANNRWAEVIAKRQTAITSRPARVILSHDRSCNISCPSCRKEVIMLDRQGSARLDALLDGPFFELVSGARSIKVTGSGDPFASRHFRKVIKKLTQLDGPSRRLQLHTNGLLFDERAWRTLNLREQVDSVWVSIDAAREETYRVTRRGGSFPVLMRNLHFLGSMRRAGAFNKFRLDFVVQRANYEEMGDLVDLADRIGADGVYFLRLRNWGTFTPSTFREMDVCHPEHPEHGALLERLADPRLAGPNVELGSVAPLLAKARSAASHASA